MVWLGIVALVFAAEVPLERELAAVKKTLASGDRLAAAGAARDLERAVAVRAPLEVFDGRALIAPAFGLGMYDPVQGGVVRGDELFLYAQVRNHTTRALAGGWYEVQLESDLIVLDAAGAELARDIGFGESRFTARAVHRDTFVNVALRTKGLATGSYRVRLVVHDKATSRTGEVEIPFAIP
ncbi:MAG: hypothetical protein HY903_03470 [Deltaproteobacteria bacterium]|nr:hypothetical protein [Deltaproteobacteria bacterium]